ncbi:MAG: TrmO family methyltransferase [Candidatus Competibacteraceae bacterium]
MDLLDGTPVLDIKPYLPYADRIPGSQGGFASTTPVTELTVEVQPQAAAFCANWLDGDLRQLDHADSMSRSAPGL